jgi:uncharacterized protein
MDRLAILISGVLFGAGVTISGMVNPMKVLNFMDIFGQWDPTLLLVMGAGLIVTFAGYRIVLKRPAPLFAPEFKLPASQLIDAKLLGGAALFGLGWGMTGFCPGPAVASLVFGRTESVMFVAAMAIGIVATRHLVRAIPAEA